MMFQLFLNFAPCSNWCKKDTLKYTLLQRLNERIFKLSQKMNCMHVKVCSVIIPKFLFERISLDLNAVLLFTAIIVCRR